MQCVARSELQGGGGELHGYHVAHLEREIHAQLRYELPEVEAQGVEAALCCLLAVALHRDEAAVDALGYGVAGGEVAQQQCSIKAVSQCRRCLVVLLGVYAACGDLYGRCHCQAVAVRKAWRYVLS